MQNEDFERQRKLIEGENINVSESNVLKEFAQIAVNIVLILVCIYFSVFIISGIVIKSLPLDKQIALENVMSKFINEMHAEDLVNDEAEKTEYIKNKILEYDKK